MRRDFLIVLALTGTLLRPILLLLLLAFAIQQVLKAAFYPDDFKSSEYRKVHGRSAELRLWRKNTNRRNGVLDA
jgi:hypothetical protein